MAVAGTVYNVVVGWTGPIDIYLRDNSTVPTGTLGGTADLILKDAAGNSISFSGNVTIYDATNWIVRVSPDAADFLTAGIYRGRIKITDDSGKIVYFPNGHWDVWIVNAEA